MVFSHGEAEEEKQETVLFQSQVRDACILRMTNG